jgi:hypothetical protein
VPEVGHTAFVVDFKLTKANRPHLDEQRRGIRFSSETEETVRDCGCEESLHPQNLHIT